MSLAVPLDEPVEPVEPVLFWLLVSVVLVGLFWP
jgi:hypothetical protein